MTKPATAGADPLRFSRPVTGRQHYVVRGALGHVNLIKRRLADAKLAQLLGTIPLKLVVVGFLESLRPGHGIRWEPVRDYLAGILHEDANRIDTEAVVAFWAAIEGELRERA